MTPKKKLIEVALPLDAINKASAREKSIRHGLPTWLRQPSAQAWPSTPVTHEYSMPRANR